MPGVAISTMARNLDHTFRDWCRYHLQVVDRIFVWLDDPAESRSAHLPLDSRVEIRIGSQYRKGSVHGDFMVRQDQNTQSGLSRCLTSRLEWLLHLDTDELLYPPDVAILQNYLKASAGHVTLLNHEVCPHWRCDNPFNECNYFKLNGRLRFNLYSNGKAAVRCRPEVYPRDAHSFGGYTGDTLTASEMVVLHYACPSYTRWLAKYTTLGYFPGFWWDNPEHRIALSFHLESRDIVRECLEADNFQPALEFWSRHVMAREQIDQLRRAGKIARFTPMQSLQRA